MMNKIFLNYQDFVIVFFYDILVFSRSQEEHMNHLHTVFELLHDNDLYDNLEKCQFFQSQIEYLGHIISAQGIFPDPKKLKLSKNGLHQKMYMKPLGGCTIRKL